MSGYIGVQPVPQATQRREYFTATNGQATFNTNGYTPNYIDVYMNGVKLSPADFTASNGSDVVLASGATTGDLVQVVSFTPFNVANQTFIGDVNLSSGAYKIGGNTVIDSSRNANLTKVRTAGSTAAGRMLHNNGYATFDQMESTGSAFVGYGLKAGGGSANEILSATSVGIGRAGVFIGALSGGTNPNIQFVLAPGQTTANGSAPTDLVTPLTISTSSVSLGKDLKVGSTTVIDTSRVGNFNTGTVIGTYTTAPSGSPGQLAISRTGSAPYVSWHHEDGTRLGNIQFANASSTLYISNEMSNGKWNLWNGTTTAVEIDHNGAAYFGGATQAAATRFVHLGGIKFSNGASTGGEFLSWDNEGNTGNQSLLAYWYDGSSYRNRFRIAGDHGETVVNGAGDDVDFRVASDTNPHCFFVDAGHDKIGMGLSDPATYGSRLNVEMNGGASNSLISCINSATSGTRRHIDFFDGTSTSRKGAIETNGTSTTYNTTSDRRLKTDIQPIAGATETLMAMAPVTHKWKAEPTALAVYGFIAQDMQALVPEAVSGDPDSDEMMSMDYGRITPVLVAALQDAHKKIEALEERLTDLGGRS